ncbi:MAG: hypothetical protein AB1465_00520 [Patescibacteria group bacterium]
MKFAQITLALPLNQFFDYSIPSDIKNIAIGSRVVIDFANRKLIGFVVGLKDNSKIIKIKPIIKLLDKTPLLSAELLIFTKLLAEYYHTSWGQMIESAIPKPLRNAKSIDIDINTSLKQPRNNNKKNSEIFAILGSDDFRFNFYCEKIKESLKNNEQILIVTPNINSINKIKMKLTEYFGIEPCALTRYQKTKESVNNWISIKNSNTKIIIGTMSTIFAPCDNLGLIIIDDEDNSAYKQERAPFYHVRNAAIIRSKINKCTLIFGSECLSIETFYLTKISKAKLIEEKTNRNIHVNIIDMNKEFYRTKKGEFLSSRLESEINSLITKGDTIGIFLNRRGFATTLKCKKCNFILKCPRCDINLVYDFKSKFAYCRICRHKVEPPKICPHCQASNLSYLGLGIEKLASYLYRVFPQANKKIDILEQKTIKENTTLKNTAIVLGDILLNMPDCNASEKTFSLFYRLFNLTINNFYIQTYLPHHYIWQAIKKNDPFIYYEKELGLRKELKFPPFWHFIQIVLRGKNSDNIKEKSFDLFKIIETKIPKDLILYPPQPAHPAKIRGNFRWQILLKTKNILKTNKFLTSNLKNLRFSNIILTINVDP